MKVSKFLLRAMEMAGKQNKFRVFPLSFEVRKVPIGLRT
jgi:hypothetical protein